jgi:predicted  nucleic acid-binding Zn-ribbon protein
MATLNPRQIVDVLRKLQAIDDEIREVRETRNGMVENLEKLQAVLEMRDGQLGEMREKLGEAETWHRKKSAELEDEREKLQRSKAKLNTVTRSKEYVAVNRELDNIRKNIQNREDEVEKLTIAIEEFRATIEREDAKVIDLRAAAEAEANNNSEALGEMDRKIELVEKRRAEIARGVDRGIMRRYKKVFDAREGTAVVVVNDDSCGGCNMVVQPRFVEAILRGSSLVQCPFCSRFLYTDVHSDENGQPVIPA